MPSILQTFLRKASTAFLFTSLLCLSTASNASHNAGGHVSYKYLGNNQYEVTLKFFRDCHHGNAIAIQEDDPLFVRVYQKNTSILVIDDTIFSAANATVPVLTSSCTNPIATCFSEMTFTKIFTLPANNEEHVVVFQRCCRNAEITNLPNAGEFGSTHYCIIPAANSGLVNSSAVFNSAPFQVVCINNPMTMDNGASDSDGDSLSFELTEPLTGGNINNAKPYPAAPPYSPVSYLSGYSYGSPLGAGANLQLNVNTGVLTAVPDQMGIFLIGVACHEWRNGVKINTSRKDYEVIVSTNDFTFKTGPNPVQDELSLELLNPEGEGVLTITDRNGKMLNRYKLELGHNHIDMKQYGTGLYFIRYNDGKRSNTSKLMKL